MQFQYTARPWYLLWDRGFKTTKYSSITKYIKYVSQIKSCSDLHNQHFLRWLFVWLLSKKTYLRRQILIYKLCSFVRSGPNSEYFWVTLSKTVLTLKLVLRMHLIDCTLEPSQRKLPSCQRLVWIWHWQYGPKLQRFPLIVLLLHWQKTLDCCRLVKYSIVLVYLVQLREFYGQQTLECELKAFKNILVPKISCLTAG